MTDQREWTLGQTSGYFESQGGGPGTVSSGQGDRGGVSYGTYQISSNSGTLADYLSKSSYGEHFKGIEVNSSEFIAEWKRLAAHDEGFGADQHAFIERTHYSPSVRSLRSIGLEVEERGAAVKDMVWSTSVQYGGGATTTRLVARGLKESYGDNYNVAELSDAEIVGAVQSSKLAHVANDFRGSPTQTPNIEARIDTENYALTHLAEHGSVPDVSEIRAHHRAALPLKVGSHGEAVADLQRGLADLGYKSSRGLSPVADGDFGPTTKEVLQNFQRDNGLAQHGEGSVLTRMRLGERRAEMDVAFDVMRDQQRETPVCRLDDPLHADHGMFKATQVLVHQLDRSHGRAPDERSDNLAASMVVAARSAGLDRVDQVALSDDASRLWGVQRPPGVRDHFFDRQASTDTMQGLNTPISESSNRWPQAVQAYDSVRQIEQQNQQQALDQQQSQGQSGPTMSISR